VAAVLRRRRNACRGNETIAESKEREGIIIAEEIYVYIYIYIYMMEEAVIGGSGGHADRIKRCTKVRGPRGKERPEDGVPEKESEENRMARARGNMRGRRWAFRGPAMITGSAQAYNTRVSSPSSRVPRL
jgi:hypothetical protein